MSRSKIKKAYAKARRFFKRLKMRSVVTVYSNMSRCPLRARQPCVGKHSKDKRCKGTLVFRSWNKYGKGVTEYECGACSMHLFYLGRKRILPLRGI